MSRLLLALTGFTLLAMPGALAAEPAPVPTTPAASTESPAAPAETLRVIMKRMGRDFKALGQAVSDPERIEANRKLVAKLIADATRSAELAPAKTEKLSEADRPAFLKDYQAGMEKLITELKKVDTALGAKNFRDAADALAACKAVTKDAHKQFSSKK